MLLNELFGDDDQGDWRAWIDPAGNVHEIPSDDTHAEWAYYKEMDDGTADFDDDEAGPDAAFEKAMNNGWIRVGLNLHDRTLYTNFFEQVTVPALKGLIGVIDTAPAANYVIDYKNEYTETSDERQAKRLLRQIMTSRTGIKEGRLMEADWEFYRKRINRLLELLRQHPEADRIYVVGSVAKGKSRPSDLDVYVNLEEHRSSEDKLLRPFNILLAWGGRRVQGVDGLFDPFVGFSNLMLVRNPNSTAWTVAKGARELRKEFKRDAVPVKDVPDLV